MFCAVEVPEPGAAGVPFNATEVLVLADAPVVPLAGVAPVLLLPDAAGLLPLPVIEPVSLAGFKFDVEPVLSVAIIVLVLV